MSIKTKIRGNGKALVKFDHPVDEQYFTWIMLEHRDDGTPHPKIILKNKDGDMIPPLKKPAPVVPIKTPKIEYTKEGSPILASGAVMPIKTLGSSGQVVMLEGTPIKPEEKKDVERTV